MKRLLSFVLTLIACGSLFAAEASFSLDHTVKSLMNSNVTIYALRLTATNTTVVNLYDNNTNNIIYTNQAYTVKMSYATNLVSSYTNTAGIITSTVTNSGLYIGTLSVAANTNNSMPIFKSISVPANGITEITGLSLAVARGITATSIGSPASNATLTVTYGAP